MTTGDDARIQGLLESIQASVRALAGAQVAMVERLEPRLVHRLDLMDPKLDQIAGRLEELAIHAAGIEVKLNRIDARLARIEAQLPPIDVRFTRIGATCTGLDTKLDTLSADTRSRLERLEIGIGAGGTPMLRKGLLRGSTRRRRTA